MLSIGDKVPSFALPDAGMEMVCLDDYLGRRNVVLYFYLKDGTPGCLRQAIDFTDLEDQFEKVDAIVFGVSCDDVLAHASFRDEHGLSVRLLSDAEGDVCRLFGVLEERALNGITKIMVNRSTFIIDKQGRVCHVFRGVNPKGHAQEVLRLLRETSKPH